MTINDALALHHAGRLAEAERAYLAVLKAQPNQYHALHFLGILKAQTGDLAASAELIAQSLALHPNNALAAFHLGETLRRLGRVAEAGEKLRASLALDRSFMPAALALAECLLQTGELQAAVTVCDEALTHASGEPALHTVRGDGLVRLGRRAEARAAYQAALAGEPQHGAALIGLARLDFDDGAVDAALTALDTAMAVMPGAAEPCIAKAILLGELGRRDEALAVCQTGLARDPANAEIYYNMGCLLLESGALQAALSAFDSTLAIDPRLAPAQYNRTFVLERLGRLEEAIAASDAALDADPKAGLAAGKSFFLRARRCDWRGREENLQALTVLIGEGVRIDPFALLVASDDPALALTAATRWAPPPATPYPARPLSQGRLRVAYLSPDFHDHPVACHAVEVFEAHDRARFETFGVCLMAGPESSVRTRLRGAFDHFLETGGQTDRDIAALLQDHHIDIAVDLAGYTADGRTSVLRFRPAPLQLAWLGYPGTTGAPYVDYLIADDAAIMPADEVFYSEKIVRLPLSYLPRDRTPADPVPSRRELGLPDDGFVFCAFNGVVKFTPALFAVWMRLVAAVPGSVLWLNSQDATAQANLRREAAAHGVAPERIVFAGRVAGRSAHLGRLAAADLFLDTFPYGAHATASDFLFAGVPVLTCRGAGFPSRVAAGMLSALGLSALIADGLVAYEAAALALARDPARLEALRAQLAQAGRHAPVFDPVRFCRDLEKAYESMVLRFAQGLPPAGFSVTLTPL
jgi:predicted O-linked N-acetylglucosamine transferase (SPINDLY family)